MTALNSYGGSTELTFPSTGYFRVEKAADRWWLVDPDGGAFITVALNHADESNLKYPHNGDVWKKKYGSREKWIRDGVVRDLKSWGFNTIGWTQEYISGDMPASVDWTRDPIDHRHSTVGWSADDFKTAGMPYVLQLRVEEIEDWNAYPAFRDVSTGEFDAYCDYLARSLCFDHAESKNLIGYFLVDIPAWLPHISGADFPQLKGLDEATRNERLFDVASTYYQTITKHIRRYDPNHLILGDRYNGNRGIPAAVLRAMEPWVDVLSVQYFPAPNQESRRQMRDDLTRWNEETAKPVIIADIGNWTATKLNPNRASAIADQRGRGEDYAAAFSAVIEEPWLVGWHWCAYVENTGRGWGVKDPWDEPYQDFVERLAEFNRTVYERAIRPVT